MFPMDFEEFLWAQNNFTTMSVIREAFNKKEPLGLSIHRTIMNQFRTYMAVGGMPQAVEAFINGDSYRTINHIKRNILTLYEEDLHKHDEEDGDHKENPQPILDYNKASYSGLNKIILKR